MIQHSSPFIEKHDIDAVMNQLSSGYIASGEMVEKFEDLLKEFLDVPYLFCCCNGTHALFLALKSLALKMNAEVILPTYVCHNVWDAVVQANLKPVLCDIGKFWSMTPDNIENVLTDKTGAIIVVHPMGMTVDTSSFKKFGIPIIEDFCQNFGGVKNGKKVKIEGDVAVFSFHATKCLTTGEGGAIATCDEMIYSELTEFIKYKSLYNPLSDLQAALGIIQLQKYSKMLSKRLNIANKYFCCVREDLTFRFKQTVDDNIFFRFLLWKNNPNFEELRNDFAQMNIAVRKGVDELLHKRYHIDCAKSYRKAEKAFNNTISIPIYPSISESDQNKIIDAVNLLL